MTARGRLLSGLVATVIALAGFVTVGAPTAAAGISGTLQYVALGDSYAAGVGAPPYVSPTTACKATTAIPRCLTRRSTSICRSNATCPGATTSTVANTAVVPADSRCRAGHFDRWWQRFGFADLAGNCTPDRNTGRVPKGDRRSTGQVATDLYSDLTLLYGDVADAAPKALIVVTGYPYLVESTATLRFDPQHSNQQSDSCPQHTIEASCRRHA